MNPTIKNRVYIIAEAGVNHNGSLQRALKLVEQAKCAGADAIKFQTFKTELLACRNSPKAVYQQKTTGELESQFEMLKGLELSEGDHLKLKKHCQKVRIDFLSTPFDIQSVDFLANQLGVARFKISSGDITDAPLLLRVALSQKPIIMSTGMCSLGDIENALSILGYGYLNLGEPQSYSDLSVTLQSKEAWNCLREKIILLHCTTEYPAPLESINLNAMSTISKAFGLPVGYSDHSKGIVVPIAAVVKGAQVIEKHFTLDKTLSGPDHQASLEPDDLAKMVAGIRAVEKALGSTLKAPVESELKNIAIARKSLVAACPIKTGEKFSSSNLTSKRPGSGISPLFYWDYLGKSAKRDYYKDDLIR